MYTFAMLLLDQEVVYKQLEEIWLRWVPIYVESDK
jgi:hypothetical protein